MVSAATGMPARPRRAATSPSWALPVRPHREVEGRGVLHRAHQHRVVDDGYVGLAEREAAGVEQLRHFGQAFAGEADRECADRIDVGAVELLCAIAQHLDQAGFIERGVGVGRDGEAGDTAGHRGGHLGIERRTVLEAGLTQARRHVDQARADHQSLRVDHALRSEAVGGGAERHHAAVGDEDVAHRVRAVGRIDEAAVADLEVHVHAASMDITAMRTAMPKVTWLRMTACAPSAMAESISTPRFIGPGCITMASDFAADSFSAVSPQFL